MGGVSIWIDHIAILTESLERSANQLPDHLETQTIENQPGEGTREQYVKLPSADTPSILLMQAVAPGPYRRAIEKRGPGLHHFGCATDHLDYAVEYLGGKGLLLHTISLTTYVHRGVWMCRPGVPFLIELFETKGTVNRVPPVTIDIPATDARGYRSYSYIPSLDVNTVAGQGVRIRIPPEDFKLDP